MLVSFKRYSVSFSRMAADIKHNINLTGFSSKYLVFLTTKPVRFVDTAMNNNSACQILLTIITCCCR